MKYFGFLHLYASRSHNNGGTFNAYKVILVVLAYPLHGKNR